MQIQGENDNQETIVHYKLADGRIVKVRVSVSVREALEFFDRQSKNLAKKERWHSVSLQPNDFFDASVAVIQDEVAELVERADDHVYLKDAIASLPPIQRRRLLLHFMDELTYQEIAEKEHVSHWAIGKSIRTALRALRDVLKE